MKTKKFISEVECNELVRQYKEKHNLKISEAELKNFHLTEILNGEDAKLNSDIVSVSLADINKEEQIKNAIENGKSVLISVTGKMNNNQPLVALHDVKKSVENDNVTYKDVDIDVAYSYDDKAYNASICLTKRG